MKLRKKRKTNLILLIGALLILLLAGVILGIVLGKKNSDSNVEYTETEDESAIEGETENAAVSEGEGNAPVPLERNMYPEVNALIEEYYQAAADGDIAKIAVLRNHCEQTELLQIQEKSRYLERYEEINCYTKPGPIEDSFVVYVSYYAKFFNVDQRVCGLNTYIVCRNEQGNYYIHDSENDEAMKAYRTSVTSQDDVVELFNQVQVEYNETLAANKELADFLAELSDKLKAAVGDALAEEKAKEEAAQAALEGNTSGTNAEPVSMIVTANDVVNIRKSDSQNSESLGKARVGEEFTLLEKKANGWSCVKYNGGIAFIKSEFLDGEAMQPGVVLDNGSRDEETQSETPQDTENTNSVNSGVPANGKFKLSDSLNVRKEPSQNADRIGVAYSGSTIEIIEHRSDGWTEVKFNGSTGYIKTEVIK